MSKGQRKRDDCKKGKATRENCCYLSTLKLKKKKINQKNHKEQRGKNKWPVIFFLSWGDRG